jgi:hypothetical protein
LDGPAAGAAPPPHDHQTTLVSLVLEEPPPKTVVKKRRCALPADFVPDGTAVNLARELRVSLKSELPQFIDHHNHKATVSSDWQASLRTWIRNAAKWAPKNQGGAPRSRNSDALDYAFQLATGGEPDDQG